MKRSAITKSILAFGTLAGLMFSASLSLTGCLTEDKKTDTTTAKNDSTPWGPEFPLTVGAQGNTAYGSAVDLDAKKVLKSSEANAAQSTIDLLFIFTGGDLKIASPVAAKAAGDVPLAANYDATKIKDTQFVGVSTKPVSSEMGDSTYAQTAKVDISFAVEGYSYMVKTTEGKLAYVRIDKITGNDNTATANLTVSLSGR
jgi:hypothetical protein